MILLLNGSINSGKSTIAKLLVQKIPDTVNLEIDKLFEFVDHIVTVDVEQVVWGNVISLCKDYNQHKLNVVISYVFGEQRAELFIKKLKPIDKEIYLFTLNPDLKIALSDRGTRKLEKGDEERIRLHYKQNVNNPEIGTVIDNSKQSSEETVNFILRKLRKN